MLSYSTITGYTSDSKTGLQLWYLNTVLPNRASDGTRAVLANRTSTTRTHNPTQLHEEQKEPTASSENDLISSNGPNSSKSSVPKQRSLFSIINRKQESLDRREPLASHHTMQSKPPVDVESSNDQISGSYNFSHLDQAYTTEQPSGFITGSQALANLMQLREEESPSPNIGRVITHSTLAEAKENRPGSFPPRESNTPSVRPEQGISEREHEEQKASTNTVRVINPSRQTTLQRHLADEQTQAQMVTVPTPSQLIPAASPTENVNNSSRNGTPRGTTGSELELLLFTLPRFVMHDLLQYK